MTTRLGKEHSTMKSKLQTCIGKRTVPPAPAPVQDVQVTASANQVTFERRTEGLRCYASVEEARLKFDRKDFLAATKKAFGKPNMAWSIDGTLKVYLNKERDESAEHVIHPEQSGLHVIWHKDNGGNVYFVLDKEKFEDDELSVFALEVSKDDVDALVKSCADPNWVG